MRERRCGRLVSTVLCLCLTGVIPTGTKATSPGIASPGRPKLVVVISVDGLSWPNLVKYRSWYTSGLKQLLDEGFVHTQAHYQHINTETSPGHASLSTGAPPRVTGIVANRWLERGPDGDIRNVYSTQMVVDPARAHVGRPAGPGTTPATLTGPGNLKVDTLGDRLVMASSTSRVVSVSGKDRTAVLLAGRHPGHLVYWFDRQTGLFVTSPYYDGHTTSATAGQAIVSPFNRDKAGPALRTHVGTQWQPLTAPAAASGPASLPGPVPASRMLAFQVPMHGLGFPHDLTFGPHGYFSSLYYSPFIDDLVTELVVDFLRDDTLGLGRGPTPDIVLVGLSGQDTVSHSYGPESHENLDLLRRLDVHVGTLLDTLARRGFSRGEIVVALSADHGFADIPEVRRGTDRSFSGGRLVDGDHVRPGFYQRLNRLLSESLCLPDSSRPIFGGEGWSMIYNHPQLPIRTVEGACGPAGRAVTAADIDRVLPEVATRFFREEIASVVLVSQRPSWPGSDRTIQYVLNDFDPDRSGDAFIIPRYGVLMHEDPIRGTGHGTHHDYDTHVPLLFWGGTWPAGSSDAAVTPYDLAPTLGAALGITLPDATGRNLAVTKRAQ